MAKLFGNRMKSRVNKREEVIIPTYTLKKQKKKISKPILALVFVAVAIFGIVYLPPMVIAEPDMTYHASIDMTGQANFAALEWASSYLRNNPEADFDNDGLTNEEELSYNTGVYIADNDNDGTTDYAELYLTETNPCVKDESAMNFVIQADSKTGNAVNTPFKLHDVVMWADDYESKARGGVIPLSDGSYNFYRFKGWVQFPGTVDSAYKVVNGIQQKLKKNDTGYFYIDSAALTNVRIYKEAPEACYILDVLDNRLSLDDNTFGKILCFILPSHGKGFITCKPALKNDLDGSWVESANANEIVAKKVGGYDEARFGRDDKLLTNLSAIFSDIDNGKNVVISLMSHEVGEIYLEVYGYTNRGNLLVADPETGKELGVINVDVIGERVLDKSGSIASYEHFAWNGCGYSSSARHRIMVVESIPSKPMS